MGRIILGVVVMLLAAGSVGAVDLQEGDVIGFTEWFQPQGSECYESFGCVLNKSITRLDVTTGEAEVVSGCTDSDCTTLRGEGPWPFNNTESVTNGKNGEVVGVTGGLIILYASTDDFPRDTDLSPIEIPECDDLSGAVEGAEYSWCEFTMAIDPITGDRSIVHASLWTGTSDTYNEELMAGSGTPNFTARAVVAKTVEMPLIPAGIPLPEWFGVLMVGFLLGASHMKRKRNGAVA